jgi:glutathione synthase
MPTEKSKRNIAFIMDPLSSLNPKKDTTMLIIEAAQKRNWHMHAIMMQDLFVENAIPMANTQEIVVDRKKAPFFEIKSTHHHKLSDFDFILMRKDPPYNVEYVYATSILDLLDQKKTIISNRPSSLRSFNEKFLVNYVSQWMPPTLFTRSREEMSRFIEAQGKVVVKPMDFMGGKGVFIVDAKDMNKNVILEVLSEDFSKTIVVQKYLPEITEGDRRIFFIGGEVFPHVMIRKPSTTDHRGNLAAGASTAFGDITKNEQAMADKIRPFLMEHGLHFVGLDMIGPYITEVNITSPTGLVQLNDKYNISLENKYLDYLDGLL